MGFAMRAIHFDLLPWILTRELSSTPSNWLMTPRGRLATPRTRAYAAISVCTCGHGGQYICEF